MCTLAPLLLDVDGDLLRQLGQNGQGAPGPGQQRNGGGTGYSTNSVNIRGDGSGQVGSPMVSSGSGSTGGGRPKSMPHVALPFEIEVTGSNVGQPLQLEANMPSAGSSIHEVIHQPTGKFNYSEFLDFVHQPSTSHLINCNISFAGKKSVGSPASP